TMLQTQIGVTDLRSTAAGYEICDENKPQMIIQSPHLHRINGGFRSGASDDHGKGFLAMSHLASEASLFTF
ncbi:hypothetical protein XENOCAPTIV_001009, partial [Xenoophorus captivus]